MGIINWFVNLLYELWFGKKSCLFTFELFFQALLEVHEVDTNKDLCACEWREMKRGCKCIKPTCYHEVKNPSGSCKNPTRCRTRIPKSEKPRCNNKWFGHFYFVHPIFVFWFVVHILVTFNLSFASTETKYRKVASRSTSRLVARPKVSRLFMKGKFDSYVLWPLALDLGPLNSRPVYCSRLRYI